MTGSVPSAAAVRTWLDGVERPVSDVGWSTRLLTSLGCAFRVAVPAGRTDDAAWWWARDRAREVAQRFGATFDEAPWSVPGAREVGWEAYGVWEHRFRAPLGTAATRLTPVPSAVALSRTAPAVPLPFPYGSRSPLADLPVPHPHLDSAAARHLAEAGHSPDTVGLWLDHTGEVCTSTAGPLLVELTDGTWVHPRAESGAVPTWAWTEHATARGARPARLELSDLVPARAYAVDETGVVTELLV